MSALTGARVGRLGAAVEMVLENANQRVSTGELNRLVAAWVAAQPPPPHKGRRCRIMYAVQVGIQPPTIVLFTVGAKLAPEYIRYLERKLRGNSTVRHPVQIRNPPPNQTKTLMPGRADDESCPIRSDSDEWDGPPFSLAGFRCPWLISQPTTAAFRWVFCETTIRHHAKADSPAAARILPPTMGAVVRTCLPHRRDHSLWITPVED